MTIPSFFRHLLFHVAAAVLVLFIVLATGEFFVPGSVLPFVDLVDLALPAMVLLGIALVFPPPRREA